MAQVPEVLRCFARTGTAEIASDPMPPNISDAYVMLRPREQWPDPGKSREALVAEIQQVAAGVAGEQLRAVAADPAALQRADLRGAQRRGGEGLRGRHGRARQHRPAHRHDPAAGAGRLRGEGGADLRLPVLTVNIDRDKAARYGLNVGDVQDTLAMAVGGRQAGTLFEGDRRFDLVVRLDEGLRTDPQGLSRLLLPLPGGAADGIAFHPPGDVATLDLELGPNQVSRENGKRLVVVSANVRGRDIGSFVAEAESRIQAEVQVPAGYWTTWGGQFEQLQSAARRLQVVVPVALLLVFTLLFMMFNNVKDGLLVFTGIPFALTGGVWRCGCGTSPCRSPPGSASSPCPGWRCSMAW